MQITRQAMNGCCAGTNLSGIFDTEKKLTDNCIAQVNFVWAEKGSDMELIKSAAQSIKEIDGITLAIIGADSMLRMRSKKYLEAHKALQEKEGRELLDFRPGDEIIMLAYPQQPSRYRISTDTTRVHTSYPLKYKYYEYYDNYYRTWIAYGWVDVEQIARKVK